MERQFVVVQILLRHGGQVQQRGRVVGMILNGGGEKLRSLARASALDARQAKAVQRLGIVGAQIQRGAETFFRRDVIAGVQLRQSELEPAFRLIVAPQRVGGELGLRRVGLVLFQPERTEIVTRLQQIAVEREGALIGRHRLVRLPGALAGDPVIIPCLRVAGHQGRGRFQFRNGRVVIAALQKFFALQQRARAGRRAAGDEQGQCQQQQKTKREAGSGWMAN